MHWFRNARYDFMTKRRLVMLVSFAPIIVGLVSMVIHGGLNTSIDFAGGTLVEVAFEEPIAIQEVRGIVERAGFTGAEVTNVGSPREVMIQIKHIGNAAEAARSIEDALQENLSGHKVDVRRVESVGPKIGGELKMAAFWAIVYSLAGIVAYVSWRFEFKMAITAIIALVHDVLFTLGIFSLANIEISINVVAALLTIIGYSLNDTIVVFDRIRENLQTRRREGYLNLVNTSVNETLSRTIVTGLTTIFSVIVLILIGGSVIRDFAVTLLIGIVVGTYSSIFIASALLVEWDLWRSKHRKRA